MTNTAKKVNLGVQIEETLRTRILNLEYPNNSVLVEEALCAEFGASRSPVREALRMLEASGLIARAQNRSYVTRQISQTGVRELYEIRLAIERYVVEKLCRVEDREPLRELLRRWESIDLRREKDPAEEDRLFHETLAKAYGNGTILNELSQINDRLRVFRVVDFSKPCRVETTKVQHIELLAAILDGDAAKALACLETNINEGLDNALDALRQVILRAHDQ